MFASTTNSPRWSSRKITACGSTSVGWTSFIQPPSAPSTSPSNPSRVWPLEPRRHPRIKLHVPRLAVEPEIGAAVDLEIVVDQVGDRSVRARLLARPGGVPVPLAPQIGADAEPRRDLQADADHLHHRCVAAEAVVIGQPVDLGTERD